MTKAFIPLEHPFKPLTNIQGKIDGYSCREVLLICSVNNSAIISILLSQSAHFLERIQMMKIPEEK